MPRPDSAPPPEANPDIRRGRRDRPGASGFVVDSLLMAWRWLTRMRTALYLLAFLGVLTLIATIVPQEPNVPTTVREWRTGESGPGRSVASLIDLVGGFDVYGSGVFLAVLLLLFTSLTACLVPRYRAWWRLVRRSRPPRSAHLAVHPELARFETDRSPSEVLAAARTLLAERRWRLRDDPEHGPASQVAAEKGHVLREGGSLVFHTSFYVLLLAIVGTQLTSFSGQVGIVEGESWAETRVGYWSYSAGRLWDDADHRGFLLTLDEFHVDWHRDPRFGGQPSVFLSDVTVAERDAAPYQDRIGGNDPLVVDGMKIHQLDWGYAPRVVVEVDGEVVHDRFLTLTLTDGGFWRGAVKAPAAEPDVGLEIAFWPYAPPDEDGTPVPTGAPWAEAPLLFFTEYRGDLQLDAAQNVNRLETAGLEEVGVGGLRPGGTFELADGVTVRFPELRRWVGFQVSSRPAVPFLLLGSVLVLLGLIPGLYALRRRLWVEPDRVGDRTFVTVAGRAFQRPQAFEEEHRRIVAELRTRLDGRDVTVGADRLSSGPTASGSSDPDPEVVPR